ncbi:phosphate ABC transporter substrate-binding/OmpA family protein [Pseudomonas sp. LH21]|uniref:phosphate ABC transporter substrate-binding/OmpA family protein n=1 Tax=Pseudomonas sp. LH21 TaxID=3114884 RepID=UPI002F934C4A
MPRLLLLLLCLLPGLACAGPAQLRIQGSNTIGAALGPALVQGLLQAQGASAIERRPGATSNETEVRAVGPDGQPVRIDIAAHGTSTGFVALARGEADLAAASRPISDSEAQQLQALGNLRGAGSEQVIGLDGVAVIVHPDNPLTQLTTEQLAQVFSGQLQRWEQLGVPGGAIHLYARDDRSGTFETFKALVLTPQQATLATQARRFESADELAAQVMADRQAIGFSGLATVHRAKALAVAEGDAPALAPSRALVASEDYPLSRRLFFYLPAHPTPQARALAEFAQSPAGQAIVAEQGFVSQQIKPQQVAAQADMPPRYRALAGEAQRLSVNFRFQEGSAGLDNKALRDVQRVGDYLRQAGKLQGKVVLVGFGDPKETPGRAALLSRLRAMAVRRELARTGVQVRDVAGMGDELPVAGNDLEQGRLRNRRVEVWVY